MKLLTTLLLLTSLSASASHYHNCDMSVTVKEIIDLEKLNSSVSSIRGEITSERNQLIKFKVDSVKIERCSYFTGEEYTLSVLKSEVDMYQKGQTLKLNYLNMGDRRSDTTSWRVLN